jgi:hypothetical protein
MLDQSGNFDAAGLVHLVAGHQADLNSAFPACSLFGHGF